MKLFYTQDYIQNIEGEDRYKYPKSLFRVTAGIGSDVLLYIGSEKTVLIDCGTAYCSKILIENIKETLSIMSKKNNKRYSLNYILLTHTHYDHIGALSDIKINWPSAIVCGNKQAYNLLKKDKVFDLITKLNNDVANEYTGEKLVTPLEKSAMQIDFILYDEDQISLGEESITACETPGHSICSMSYYIKPKNILVLCESTGLLRGCNEMTTCILNSFIKAEESVNKCSLIKADYLVFPHYGIISARYKEDVFDLVLEQMHEKKEIVLNNYKLDNSWDDIVEIYVNKYWKQLNSKDILYDVFYSNCKSEIKAILRDYNISNVII